MSRKEYRGFSSSHEKKMTKKERKEQLDNARAAMPQEELIPTQEDTEQIKHLALYATIGIGLLLLLMYWLFMKNL